MERTWKQENNQEMKYDENLKNTDFDRRKEKSNKKPTRLLHAGCP